MAVTKAPIVGITAWVFQDRCCQKGHPPSAASQQAAYTPAGAAVAVVQMAQQERLGVRPHPVQGYTQVLGCLPLVLDGQGSPQSCLLCCHWGVVGPKLLSVLGGPGTAGQLSAEAAAGSPQCDTEGCRITQQVQGQHTQ